MCAVCSVGYCSVLLTRSPACQVFELLPWATGFSYKKPLTTRVWSLHGGCTHSPAPPRAARAPQQLRACCSGGPAAAGAQGPLGKESTQARTGPAAQPAEFLGGSPPSLGSSPPPALPTNPASGDVNSNPETPAKCEQLGPLGPVCLSMQFYVKFISPYKSKHACTVICFLMYLHF